MAKTGSRPDTPQGNGLVLSPQPGSPRRALLHRDNQVRIFSGVVALGLNALLIAALVLALNKRTPPIVTPSVVVSLVKIPPKPVQLTIQPKLIAAKETQIALPKFDITPVQAPVNLTSTAQGLMASQASGAGNGGGTARKLVAPVAPPPPPPNCETMDAYLERVRSEIKSYQVYPVNAQMKHLEGVVTLHFIANKRGSLLVYAIAGSTIVRTLYSPDNEGHQQPISMTFEELAPNRWSYKALYIGPPVTAGGPAVNAPVGDGTVTFDANGVPTEINGGPPGPGKIALTVPHSVTGQADKSVSVDLGAIGITMLNDETLKMIQNAQPLPSIPDCLKMQNLSAVMPFGYTLGR